MKTPYKEAMDAVNAYHKAIMDISGVPFYQLESVLEITYSDENCTREECIKYAKRDCAKLSRAMIDWRYSNDD